MTTTQFHHHSNLAHLLSQYLGKSLCNTSETFMTLKPFYTLLLNQTLYNEQKADTVGDGITSSPTSSKPHTDQRSVFTFSSLVALLALLASILLIISSFFRFHNKYFRKFDCFTCHCGKMHFALNEIHTVGL